MTHPSPRNLICHSFLSRAVQPYNTFCDPPPGGLDYTWRDSDKQICQRSKRSDHMVWISRLPVETTWFGFPVYL